MNLLCPHSTLQIEPTRRCNLNCDICMRPFLDETSLLLSPEDFKKMLNSWDVRHVALHGWGEPLLHPQLFEMVRYAESQGVSTELTTNGTLLQANIEKVFSSGLSIIVFGIHKVDILPVAAPQIKELITHRNRNRLERPRAYFDITIYRGNQSEIAQLIEAAAQLDLDGVVLHRVFGINPDTGYISSQEEKELFARVKGMARYLKIKLYLPPEPCIPCNAVNYSLFVSCQGQVSPCPFLPHFYLADGSRENLQEVLTSQAYKQFVRDMQEHPVCGRCPLGSTNGSFYGNMTGDPVSIL